jgi:PAS domain S-box-containing protein
VYKFGYTKGIEFRVLTKKGSEISIEYSANLLRDAYGNVVGAVGIARDITDRKKAEESLRNNEKRFRELSELLPETIYEADSRGVLTFVNKETYTKFGYTKQDFERGLNAIQFMAPEDHERAKKNLGRVLNGEWAGPTEYEAIRKDGSTFPMIIKSVPIIHDDKVVGIRGIMVDITDRKKAEDKLRESEEKFRNLADQSPNIIFINIERNIVYVNRKYEEVLGYTLNDLSSLGFNIHGLIVPEHVTMVQSHFSKHRSDEEAPPLECTLIKRNGTKIDVILTTRPIKYGGQNAILGTITDITQRKKAENTLKEMLKELEKTNEKLGVIGKFTRHDIRNKLSLILNHIYLAKRDSDNIVATFTQLEKIESTVYQIEKLLGFLRIYERMGTEETSYIDVKKTVKEAISLLTSLDDIKLVNECDGLTVLADSLLRQVFYNLIENTMKHGEKVTKIKLHCTEDEQGLKLFYEDDGVGIPANEKELIFNEGYGKGTGYGLYLIKKICEAYGWKFTETGTPGKGAKFVMTIPKVHKNGKNSYKKQKD